MNKHCIYSKIGTENFTHRIFELLDEHLLSGTDNVNNLTLKMMENLVFELRMTLPEINKTNYRVNIDTNTSSTK